MINKFQEGKIKMYNKKGFRFFIVLILVIITAGAIIYNINVNSIIDVKENYNFAQETMSLNVIVNQDNYVLQRINEKYKNSIIDVYYPVTKYELLNAEIKNVIDVKIAKFKENIKDDLEYSLVINFDVNKYDNYIGFVFHVLENYLVLHPNSYIFTIEYNIKNNRIINIDTLISKNNNILNLMSSYAYKILTNNEKIKKINMPYMLTTGTKPIKNNFEDLIFTKDGIIVFFEKYQIAPYSADEFSVTIPYTELNLNIAD